MNKSQSQNEYIGIDSSSLYTQENRQGIEECMGENNERKGAKEDCQVRMQNISKKSNELSLGNIYNSKYRFTTICNYKYF
jgi:hypothetical protein